MQDKIDKRLRAAQFRQRLASAMTTAGQSQAALARHIGVDRSTISQLLSGQGARLPNAQVVGECAAALGVSADWLLSLSDRPETAAALLANSLTLTEAPRAMMARQKRRDSQRSIGSIGSITNAVLGPSDTSPQHKQKGTSMTV